MKRKKISLVEATGWRLLGCAAVAFFLPIAVVAWLLEKVKAQ